MVAVPLGVVMGSNEPQVASELPGVQLHVTPAFWGSRVTVAVTGTAGAPGCTNPGGGWLMVTSILLILELLPPQPATYVKPRVSRTIQRALRFIAGLLWIRSL